MSIFHSVNTPHITEATLKVFKFDESKDFYQRVIGLNILLERPEYVILGSSGKRMLTLLKSNKESSFNEGLYHIAFLLPSETDLANWLTRQLKRRTTFIGASNHIVSKALYLEDPNGFGIEVYADTSEDTWIRNGESIKMDTLPLDIDSLLSQADGANISNIQIGHIHLKQKNIKDAMTFYQSIGMNLTFDLGSASFMSFGGYHHHLGVNMWNQHAMKPHDQEVGLQEMTISYPKQIFNEVIKYNKYQLEEIGPDYYVAHDPIGIQINLKHNKGEQENE